MYCSEIGHAHLVCPVCCSTPCILLYTPYAFVHRVSPCMSCTLLYTPKILYNLIPKVATACILSYTCIPLYILYTLVHPVYTLPCIHCILFYILYTPLYTLYSLVHPVYSSTPLYILYTLVHLVYPCPFCHG